MGANPGLPEALLHIIKSDGGGVTADSAGKEHRAVKNTGR